MQEQRKPMIERDPEDTLDRVLRPELVWQTPPDVTCRLLELIPGAGALEMGEQPAPSLSLPQAPVFPRPKTWYTVLVACLTAMAVVLSLLVAWQFYSALGAELTSSVVWQQLQAAPVLIQEWLYTELPATQYMATVMSGIYKQLHWLLAAIVLWLALDGWSPSVNLQHQQEQHVSG